MDVAVFQGIFGVKRGPITFPAIISAGKNEDHFTKALF